MIRKLGGLTVLIMLLGAWATSAQTIYGSAYVGADGPATLYSVSPTTGTATPIGPIGSLQVGSLAFAPNGTLYGISNSSSGGRGNALLLTINTTTGAGTLVGDTGITFNFNDIAFRADGTLFGIANHGTLLYTIDTTTGLATLVGDTGLVDSEGNGLAFSSANVLYTANDTGLHSLNQSTGAHTLVVALNYSQFGTTLSRVNGMKFDPFTGKLYASVATFVGPGQQTRSLGIINPVTGVVTRIGPTVAGLDAIAIPSSIPGIHSVCIWGFYINNPSQGWESRLFVSNIDTQNAHNYGVIFLATNTVRSTSFSLPPNGLMQLLCGDLDACGASGWLYVQSDAPVFGSTLFVLNSIFGGGSFTAQSPDCFFIAP